MSKRLKCTTEQADATQSYLWRLRDALCLGHWDVYLSSRAADSDCHASIHPTEGRWVAEVRVRGDFWDLDDGRKRSILTHELLHLVHRDLGEITRKGLLVSGYLPHKVYRLVWEQTRLELELMVDHLAAVIAPTMPAWPSGSAEPVQWVLTQERCAACSQAQERCAACSQAG